MIFRSVIAQALKETLNDIIDDDSDGYESGADYKVWCDTKTMRDAWEDDQEYGGPGLASEKAEGEEMATGTINEGYTTRYMARTFALKLHVTEEAMEDNKYEKVIRAASRLKRSMYKTIDIDCTYMLARATNASYVGGDGVALGSTAHTLPDGGTWSNLLATAASPSRAAIIAATSQIRKFPGHDGITEGCEPKRVLCPTEQWAVWEGLLKSGKAPENNNNEINVVNSSLNLTVKPLKHWANTTTAWGIQTDADNGMNIRFRRKPRSRSWVDNAEEVMSYGISARWARGWSDARSFLFSDA